MRHFINLNEIFRIIELSILPEIKVTWYTFYIYATHHLRNNLYILRAFYMLCRTGKPAVAVSGLTATRMSVGEVGYEKQKPPVHSWEHLSVPCACVCQSEIERKRVKTAAALRLFFFLLHWVTSFKTNIRFCGWDFE